MKLINADLLLSIDLDENIPTQWVIEKPSLMAEVVSEIFEQCQNGSGSYILSDDQKELPMERWAEIIVNPFLIDFNSRKIQNRLYNELIDAGEGYVEDKSYIQSLIIGYLDKLIQEVPYQMITSNLEIELAKLLKMYEVRLEPQYSTLLEKLVEYSKVLTRLLEVHFLVLVNICSYLETDELKEFMQMCSYLKLHILLIESEEKRLPIPSRTYIIDRDLCWIIK